MADTRHVDLALTTERPALPEVAGILLVCALVFALLVHFDGAAARHEEQRARAELKRRAAVANETATPGERRTRGGNIGAAGPVSVPVGAAWSSGTSASVAHASADHGSGPPASVLAVLAGVGAIMAATGSVLLLRGPR